MCNYQTVRQRVEIVEMKCSFMPGCRTTDAIWLLRSHSSWPLLTWRKHGTLSHVIFGQCGQEKLVKEGDEDCKKFDVGITITRSCNIQ